MDTNRLIKIIELMIEQTTNEQITEMKAEIFKSRYKVSQMEIKLSIAYEELARTKEDLNLLLTSSTSNSVDISIP